MDVTRQVIYLLCKYAWDDCTHLGAFWSLAEAQAAVTLPRGAWWEQDDEGYFTIGGGDTAPSYGIEVIRVEGNEPKQEGLDNPSAGGAG